MGRLNTHKEGERETEARRRAAQEGEIVHAKTHHLPSPVGGALTTVIAAERLAGSVDRVELWDVVGSGSRVVMDYAWTVLSFSARSIRRVLAEQVGHDQGLEGEELEVRGAREYGGLSMRSCRDL